MEHSAKFNKVLNYYGAGFWTKKMVRTAVVKNWITPAEFKEITGEDY